MSQSVMLDWLVEMARRRCSDLYVTCGAPPTLRGDEGLVALDHPPLDGGDLSRIVASITTSEQQAQFSRESECNLSVDLGHVGRFRVNIFRQRQQPGVVVRRIEAKVPTFASLGLPTALADLVMERRGIVVMVGGTGSGKSTSLAAMIDHRNSREEGHILTIEDPIEYLHEHKRCIVTQREVGADTRSFDAALKNALRQKPDVILIGEIRDAESMRHALTISETGHLALATLHANNADQAIDRIANFFDPTERRSVLLNLAFNLRGIVSQRLVRTVEGRRAAAVEVLLNLDGVPELVRAGETSGLKALMRAGEARGMATFDRSLLDLRLAGRIADAVALAESDDRDWMAARLAEIPPSTHDNTTGSAGERS